MIVANIKGGLCNQLFQIAAGYAHAMRCNTYFGINYDMGNYFQSSEAEYLIIEWEGSGSCLADIQWIYK